MKKLLEHHKNMNWIKDLKIEFCFSSCNGDNIIFSIFLKQSKSLVILFTFY